MFALLGIQSFLLPEQAPYYLGVDSLLVIREVPHCTRSHSASGRLRRELTIQSFCYYISASLWTPFGKRTSDCVSIPVKRTIHF
ncbi:UNVERIFIED_ORG: hypothetical protein J2Y78_004913 [Buttiauxella agrestis ATCC 33320]